MKGINGKLIRRKHSRKDWLKIGVLVVAGVVACLFVVGLVGRYAMELQALGELQTSSHRQMLFDINSRKTDSTPEKTYAIVRQALIDGDVETVIDYIHPQYRWKYEDDLRAAAADGKLSELAERTTPLTEKIREYGNVIIYKTTHIPGNDSENILERYSEEVEFIQDIDGVWKISSI
jgi:uncharacterized membrane protein YcjF (UPF0283 family)